MRGCPVRVLVVDDHEIVRRGLVRLVEATMDLAVCGEAGGVAQAVLVAEETEPEVVLVDLRLPDGTGVQASRQIRSRRPETDVVLLTIVPEEDALLAAVLSGASGYLLKQLRGHDIVEAVRSVAAGRPLLDPHDREAGMQKVLAGATGASLDDDEKDLLTLVAEGNTDAEICVRLGLDLISLRRRLDPLFARLLPSVPGKPLL